MHDHSSHWVAVVQELGTLSCMSQACMLLSKPHAVPAQDAAYVLLSASHWHQM
jgi:hypothetical protein